MNNFQFLVPFTYDYKWPLDAFTSCTVILSDTFGVTLEHVTILASGIYHLDEMQDVYRFCGDEDDFVAFIIKTGFLVHQEI